MFDTTTASSILDQNRENSICCEVCLEPFRPALRHPKILPCGHNFCEQCLFSIYCHQQYYLLDSISCPTCRRSYPAETAISAPTNFDLCKLLENISRARDGNVTVINVDGSQPKKRDWDGQLDRVEMQDLKNKTKLSMIVNASLRKKSRQLIRCKDCGRKMGAKAVARVARACLKCSSTTGFLELSCLECCVDVHNSHGLLSALQVEEEQARALKEMEGLNAMANQLAESVHANHNNARKDFKLLLGNEKRILRECLRVLKEGERALKSPQLLSPSFILAIRRAAMQHTSRLSHVVKMLENEKAKASAISKSEKLTRSELRQSRLCLRGGDSLARESLATLLSMLPSSCSATPGLSSLLSAISPTDTNEQRICIYITVAKLLTDLLSTSLPPPIIPHFADALLHVFSQMNDLSIKRIGAARTPRATLWKTVQTAYSEMNRVVAKLFPCHHCERVDIIDDFSYACRLYADVCDQASVTLCMIESERARKADEQRKCEAVLMRIDENLMECRRLQKLSALRKSSEKRDIKGFFRFGCLRPKEADP